MRAIGLMEGKQERRRVRRVYPGSTLPLCPKGKSDTSETTVTVHVTFMFSVVTLHYHVNQDDLRPLRTWMAKSEIQSELLNESYVGLVFFRREMPTVAAAASWSW